jgi:hypothetical protein
MIIGAAFVALALPATRLLLAMSIALRTQGPTTRTTYASSEAGDDRSSTVVMTSTPTERAGASVERR